MSPMAKISGWPGIVRSGSTTSRPPRPVGLPIVRASGSAVTPVAQIVVWAWMIVPSLRWTRSDSTFDTPTPRRTSTPRRRSVLQRPL